MAVPMQSKNAVFIDAEQLLQFFAFGLIFHTGE